MVGPVRGRPIKQAGRPAAHTRPVYRLLSHWRQRTTSSVQEGKEKHTEREMTSEPWKFTSELEKVVRGFCWQSLILGSFTKAEGGPKIFRPNSRENKMRRKLANCNAFIIYCFKMAIKVVTTRTVKFVLFFTFHVCNAKWPKQRFCAVNKPLKMDFIIYNTIFQS